MWNKNVAYIVIRPQRYTKEFVDNADSFSLTFFDESFKEALSYLGTKSVRDNVPYFQEANISIFCRKLFAQEYKPESFTDQELNEKIYPNADHHTLYIGEVTKILVRE